MQDNYLKTVDSDWYRHRLSGSLIFVLAFFLILGARLYYLQVVKGAEFRRLSQNNCVRLRSIPPPRGLIFDRTGRMIVDNRPSFNVSIVLEDAEEPEKVVTRLSSYLEEDPETLLDRLEKRRGGALFKPILLKRDLSRDAVAVVEAHKLDLPGVIITVEPMRHYIEEERACHLIGYLGEISEAELNSGDYPETRSGDFIGRFGIEKSYEADFRGKPGRKQVQVNALGQVTRVLKTVPAKPGKNFYLALDLELQRIAEEMFEEKVGAAVALDPSNGHVLAMVSSPAFNPNAFVEGMSEETWKELATNPFHPMRNKAIQGQYPPGSTYKIVTAAAALEEAVIDASTQYFCPGYYRYGNRTYRCWRRGGHGPVELIQGIAQSCDVFFYRLGEQLGVDRLAEYAEAFGLGGRTGVALDNEAPGLVPTQAWKLRKVGVPWQGGETMSVAIGQGFNLVTPIQMATLTAAVANGGTLYKPLLVARIEDVNNEEVTFLEPEEVGRLPASDKTLERIRTGLVEVVNGDRGTGGSAKIDGVTVAGKTGTAQVVAMGERPDPDEEEKIPLRFRDHAWFVAYAPAKEPKIAVSVLVQHGGHGGATAGPIAGKMIRTYLGVEDSETEGLDAGEFGVEDLGM